MGTIRVAYKKIMNFGDALSPALVAELSGCTVTYFKDHEPTAKKLRLLDRIWPNKQDDEEEGESIPQARILVGLGSVMGLTDKYSCIWGAGFLNYNEKFKGGDVYAVRGRLTHEKLERDGFKGCEVWGDPTLLLPFWINNEEPVLYKVGIIPHWSEVEYFQLKYGEKYKVIDVRTLDVQGVVKEIRQCAFLLSSSLKGLIVSHAYKIPALWIKNGYIGTDDFKFHDYFSSVDIPSYRGFAYWNEILENEEEVNLFFIEHRDKSNINNSLSEIQRALLNAAPFELKDKYEKMKAVSGLE